jgi:hypothetical protein
MLAPLVLAPPPPPTISQRSSPTFDDERFHLALATLEPSISTETCESDRCLNFKDTRHSKTKWRKLYLKCIARGGPPLKDITLKRTTTLLKRV